MLLLKEVKQKAKGMGIPITYMLNGVRKNHTKKELLQMIGKKELGGSEGGSFLSFFSNLDKSVGNKLKQMKSDIITDAKNKENAKKYFNVGGVPLAQATNNQSNPSQSNQSNQSNQSGGKVIKSFRNNSPMSAGALQSKRDRVHKVLSDIGQKIMKKHKMNGMKAGALKKKHDSLVHTFKLIEDKILKPHIHKLYA
jgi:hypothetical protein